MADYKIDKLMSIPEFPGYFASRGGEIFSNKKDGTTLIQLKPRLDSAQRYLMVKLCNKGDNRHRYIHKLMVATYLDNASEKPCINHINGVKTDNRINNLERCTNHENILHARKLGLYKDYGEDNFQAKLTVKDILFIRENHQNFTKRQLSSIFNVSKSQIYRIINKERWGHIG